MKKQSLAARKAIAEDFTKYYSGKLEQKKLDDIVETFLNTTQAFPANAVCVSAVFYVRVEVTFDGMFNLPRYDGNCGGIFIPGVNITEGYIYTDNKFNLTSTTVSFAAHLTAVNDTVLFFDSSHNLVGNYQGVGGGSVAGGGGGSGTWVG
jgi:hypothetical protein